MSSGLFSSTGGEILGDLRDFKMAEMQQEAIAPEKQTAATEKGQSSIKKVTELTMNVYRSSGN